MAPLPRGQGISYVLHYWDVTGVHRGILTPNPSRGLRPPVVGGRSPVLAAFQGVEDITPAVKEVAASFNAGEGGVSPCALDAFLRQRRGVGLRSHPVVVTDADLREQTFCLT